MVGGSYISGLMGLFVLGFVLFVVVLFSFLLVIFLFFLVFVRELRCWWFWVNFEVSFFVSRFVRIVVFVSQPDLI